MQPVRLFSRNALAGFVDVFKLGGKGYQAPLVGWNFDRPCDLVAVALPIARDFPCERPYGGFRPRESVERVECKIPRRVSVVAPLYARGAENPLVILSHHTVSKNISTAGCACRRQFKKFAININASDGIIKQEWGAVFCLGGGYGQKKDAFFDEECVFFQWLFRQGSNLRPSD